MAQRFREEFVRCEVAGLRPVLRQWIVAVRRYNEQMEIDHAWNYHERAHIGFLAAAAWLAGGVALEEWRTKKTSSKLAREGRCDLYVYRRPMGLHIEAKHAWIQLTANTDSAVSAVQGNLRKAVQNACDLPVVRGDTRVGILFAVPFISGKDVRHAKPRLLAWLNQIRQLPGHTALAWVFDGQLLDRRGRTDVYPGAVLLARRALRRDA